MYDLIHKLKGEFKVCSLCEVLGVGRTAYYNYCNGQTYRLKEKKQRIADQIKQVFQAHQGRYGSRRIQVALAERGLQVGLAQIRSRMRQMGLQALQPKGFVPRTTQDNPSLVRIPNLLLLEGQEYAYRQAVRPNQIWVGDITYLPDHGSDTNKWLYLAVWMDLFSRLIVGWQVDVHMEARLIMSAFQKAVSSRKFDAGLIVHSDGGGQYKSLDFRAMLQRSGCQQSMTRKDNHYDNAHIESYFGRFKTELLKTTKLFGLQDAKLKIFEYIDGYYNTQRHHSGIGYDIPTRFEQVYWNQHYVA